MAPANKANRSGGEESTADASEVARLKLLLAEALSVLDDAVTPRQGLDMPYLALKLLPFDPAKAGLVVWLENARLMVGKLKNELRGN